MYKYISNNNKAFILIENCRRKCKNCFLQMIDYSFKKAEMYDIINDNEYIYISGGEFLANEESMDILYQAKNKNKTVVLKTNGDYPYYLKEILSNNLVKELVYVITDFSELTRCSTKSGYYLSGKDNVSYHLVAENDKLMKQYELMFNRENEIKYHNYKEYFKYILQELDF